ncbi:hypothetical protein MC7420_6507 [Coleofasciculus chthonoplastes PCC 7420]|uniref:Uncharacterized protein n=1 Tax=Coleofasciculus chthonoplastes PCC 7420 TaxID=118168 RepID=B4VR09_9CYAN|nr:hypothetical protein [Coleofasciculus chthonoplastes]EDX75852.1 hypothetical protein MC7420_6507 [Coleofasciculus chthonoplastes PCC 7420]
MTNLAETGLSQAKEMSVAKQKERVKGYVVNRGIKRSAIARCAVSDSSKVQ